MKKHEKKESKDIDFFSEKSRFLGTPTRRRNETQRASNPERKGRKQLGAVREIRSEKTRMDKKIFKGMTFETSTEAPARAAKLGKGKRHQKSDQL